MDPCRPGSAASTFEDEALAAGQDVIVSWPFEEGDIKDYVQAEALWYALLALIQV